MHDIIIITPAIKVTINKSAKVVGCLICRTYYTHCNHLLQFQTNNSGFRFQIVSLHTHFLTYYS